MSVTGRPSGLWWWLQATLAALAALALAAWLVDGLVWRVSMGFMAAGLTLWACRPKGWQLHWDGRDWHCVHGSGPAVRVTCPRVMLDLGFWMLLKVRPAAGPSQPTSMPAARRPVWRHAFWLDSAAVPSAALWSAFRATVYFLSSHPEGLSDRAGPTP